MAFFVGTGAVFTFYSAFYGDQVVDLPASVQEGDLLIAWVVARDAAYGHDVGDESSTSGTSWQDNGWTQIDLDSFSGGTAGNAVYAKAAGAAETDPTVRIVGSVSGQIAAFRDALDTPVAAAGQANASGQDIAYPSLAVPEDGCVVFLLGHKLDDWTSVATEPGFDELWEVDQTDDAHQGLVWDYQIQTNAADIASDSFAVSGGAGAISFGRTLAFPASNTAPTADAGPDQIALAGNTVQLDGSGSSDPNGDPLSYSWTVVDDGGTGLTTAELTGASTAIASFTAPPPAEQTETFVGSGTWTAPSGISSVTAQAWGGGAGSGEAGAESDASSGGGGGAYASGTTAVAAGTAYEVAIGAGGLPGLPGESGGDSSFAGSVIAKGGSGGSFGSGGAGGSAADSTGGTTFSGGAGGNPASDQTVGGGGGGSALIAAAGGDGASGDAGGAGGNGTGDGGDGANANHGGLDGLVPGGGGGGQASAYRSGGSGASGQVTLNYTPVSVDVVLQLKVTDGGGLSDTDTVTITVEATAQVSGAGQSGTAGSATATGEHAGLGAGISGSEATAAQSTERAGSGAGESVSTGTSAETTTRYAVGAGTSGSRGSGSGIALQFAAAGIARPIVGMTPRLIDAAGQPGEYLPDWTQIAFTDIYNGKGTVVLDYTHGGVNYDQLVTDRAEGALFDGSQEIPATRFLVTQQAIDDVTRDDTGNIVTLNCPLWVPAMLDAARVYPAGWPDYDTNDTKHHFAAATPGAIVGSLIADAQARGALSELETTFSATETSDGQPWDQVVTLDLDSGGTLGAALTSLTELGVLDWLSYGRELVLLNPNSGADRTTGGQAVVFQAGRDMLDAPTKRDVGELTNAVLVKGDGGTFVEVVDETSVAAHGRLEGHISQSGISDAGTLAVLGQAELLRTATPKLAYTHAQALFAEDGPQPWVDYAVGDFILRDVGDGQLPQPFLVRQLSATYAQDGTVTGAVTLGDRFDATDVALSRRIDALTNGSSGSSAPAPTPQPPATDTIAPLTPTGLLVTSAAYEAGQGATWAAVAADWNEVTENEDASPAADLEGYDVRWRAVGDLDANPWQFAGSATDTDLTWSPVPANLQIYVQVRTRDYSGNTSPWSDSVSHTTSSDTEPPPQPTAPVVTPYLGQLKVRHDGTGTDDLGNPTSMPEDTKFIRVHLSSSAGFIADESNHEDTLPPVGGTSVLTDLTYGQTYFIKLVAVDHTGNESAPSVEASGTPQQIVNFDLGPDAVDQANIRNAAIGTAQIKDLAVNSAKIASLEVGKLTGGLLDADVVVGGRVATALTGARVELNSIGLQQYNWNGDLTVNIENGGDALFVGELRSAISGRRIVYNADMGQPEIQFHSEVSNPNQSAKFYVAQSSVNTDMPIIVMVGPDANENNVVNGLSLDQGSATLSRFVNASGDPDYGKSWENIGIEVGRIYANLNIGGNTDSGNFQLDEHSWSGQAGEQDSFRPFWFYGSNASSNYTIQAGMRSDSTYNEGYYLFAGGNANTELRGDGGLEVRNNGGGGYAPAYATDFYPQSGRDIKKNVRPMRQSGLDILRGAPVAEWQYLTEQDDSEPHIGFMAESLPIWLRKAKKPSLPPDERPEGYVPLDEPWASSPSLSLVSMVGLLAAAVRDLDIEIDDMRRGARLPIPQRITDIVSLGKE